MNFTNKILASFLLSLPIGFTSYAGSWEGNSDMENFVNDLMNRMTLEEKLGQLNLPATGDIVTGEAKNSDVGKMVAEGRVGAVLCPGSG